LAGEARVAGRSWTGEYALRDPGLELMGELAGRDRKQQHAHPRATVRRLCAFELVVDAGLTAAADHRGPKARHGFGRLPRPAGTLRSDDDRGRPHAERFRKGVVNAHAVDGQVRHGTSSNGSGRSIRLARTLIASGAMP